MDIVAVSVADIGEEIDASREWHPIILMDEEIYLVIGHSYRSGQSAPQSRWCLRMACVCSWACDYSRAPRCTACCCK